MAEEAPNPFGLALSLRIVQLEDAVKVMDAGDRVAAYIYVAVGRERQVQTKRVSPAEDVEIANTITRALRDAIEAIARERAA